MFYGTGGNVAELSRSVSWGESVFPYNFSAYEPQPQDNMGNVMGKASRVPSFPRACSDGIQAVEKTKFQERL